ncbi:MAG: HD family phosphohydrolase [Clostridia bacterium]|nr:HD family phosphohydrolase [Clostridia bacterium]
MTKDLKEKIDSNIEFQNIIKDLITNETVLKMKNYRQHYETDCFEHCYRASYYCYKICKKLKLDYKSAARGAMLHDLFLYDWREKSDRKGLHAFTHGRYALENATQLFELNEIEKNMILRHMWPVTPIPPKHIEGVILTFVDKHCAMAEFKEHLAQNKILKYAYIVFAAIFFKKIG